MKDDFLGTRYSAFWDKVVEGVYMCMCICASLIHFVLYAAVVFSINYIIYKYQHITLSLINLLQYFIITILDTLDIVSALKIVWYYQLVDLLAASHCNAKRHYPSSHSRVTLRKSLTLQVALDDGSVSKYMIVANQ